ncbi:MAG: TRAP transporter small permease [Alphaproteobacteria bacterium]|nr:TRAP transporter small permease [Alphaproteobacteria bacterium]
MTGAPLPQPEGAACPKPRFGQWLEGLNALGTFWIFALLVLINCDIFGRGALNSPIRGVPELVSLSIVGIVFLQLPHALRMGRWTRSDVFIGPLIARRPRLGHLLQGLFHLTGAVLLAIMAMAGWDLFDKAWREDLYVGAAGDFTAPEWPIRAITVIGTAACVVQFLIFVWRDIRAGLGAGEGR